MPIEVGSVHISYDFGEGGHRPSQHATQGKELQNSKPSFEQLPSAQQMGPGDQGKDIVAVLPGAVVIGLLSLRGRRIHQDSTVG
jgi:hypothetical protein